MERSLNTIMLSLALSSAACGEVDLASDELATRSQAISDPLRAGTTPVTDDGAGAVIVRSIAGSGANCVGMLLTNQWVLTSRVCVNDVNPEAVRVQLPGSMAIQLGAEIRVTSGIGAVALIRLQSPFRINGSSSNHYIPLYDGDVTSLRGKTLRCYGKEYPSGALRTAEFPVQSVRPDEYVLVENNKRQQLWVYDDGAPCVLQSGPGSGIRYVTGTMHFFRSDSLGRQLSDHLFVGAFRDWVYQSVAPQLQLINTEARSVENLKLTIEFITDGQPHTDYQEHGRLDHLITDRLYAYGGKWDGTKWIGDFLSTVRHDYSLPGSASVPRMVLIRKDDPRAVRSIRLHANFTIGGQPHYDYEDLGDLVSTKNVILNAVGGKKEGGLWVGNFLRGCQSPACP